MTNIFQQVGEFHKAMGQPSLETPQVPDLSRVKLRAALLLEEVREVFGALQGAGDSQRLAKIQFWIGRMIELTQALTDEDIANIDLENLAKELADVHYVVAGFDHEFGIPGDKVSDEVHRSNMSKLGPNGKPVFDANGKVQKGPNYSPANVGEILFPPLPQLEEKPTRSFKGKNNA